MNTENHYQETDLGNIAPNPRGKYRQEESYEYLDLVVFEGGSYVCLAENGTTITGISPESGKTTQYWQVITIPGNLTPEYISMHDRVANLSEQVEADADEVRTAEQNVSGMEMNVAQMQEQTRQSAEATERSKDSAAGYASSADASRRAAEESEQNVNAQVSGFDSHVAEKVREAESDIETARIAANQSVVTQKNLSVDEVIRAGNQKISEAGIAADEATKKAQESAKYADDAKTYADNAMQYAKDAAAQKESVKKEGAAQIEFIKSESAAQKEAVRNAGTEQKQAVSEVGDAQAQRVIDTADRAVDIQYSILVSMCSSKAEVDRLFAEWWQKQYDPETYTKADMMERWFGKVLNDDRIHGCVTPLYAKSTSMLGELTDDSAGLVCTPSTELAPGDDPFAHLPQFWCVEVSAEKKADGSHEIYYVEHIDDTAYVRSGEHLCWVLQKNTYKREWQDAEYKYLKTRCTPAPGYKRWPEGKDRTGKVHEYMAHPKYYAGIDADGRITCGTGLKPVNRTSHQNGVTKWRTRGAQYSGASGSLPKFMDAMMRLKYGRKGNSGKIEGCTNYDYQYTVAVGETGVERVILTTAQAANLFVGSAVMLGIKSGSDRNTASNYSIFDGKLITAIETVNIDGTDYSAVYVDNGGATFDTKAGSTYLSTSPYYSGWNDNVQGRDGSRYSPTSGKEPGMIQGVEFMNGSYLIVSDELWRWSTDSEGNYNFDCFKCRDQSKVGSVINDNYDQITGAHLVYPAGTTGAWSYITDNIIDDDVLWPEATTAAGSGVGVGAGFYRSPASSGVRSAWCFGYLGDGGSAGVACRFSSGGPSIAYWSGSLGAPGSEG